MHLWMITCTAIHLPRCSRWRRTGTRPDLGDSRCDLDTVNACQNHWSAVVLLHIRRLPVSLFQVPVLVDEQTTLQVCCTASWWVHNIYFLPAIFSDTHWLSTRQNLSQSHFLLPWFLRRSHLVDLTAHPYLATHPELNFLCPVAHLCLLWGARRVPAHLCLWSAHCP